MMCDYVTAYPGSCIGTLSLGWLRYLSAMKLCDVVIGNSSSGIMEAPVFRVPTVNIGDRQKGRIRPKSVIDCAPDKDSIQEAILKALSTDFKDAIIDLVNPFEIEGSSNLIMEKLLATDWDNLLKKRFFDLNIVNDGF